MRLALYQPDMPQNTAALLRLAACLDLPVEVIEPCGFLWDDRRLRRVGMDYAQRVETRRHTSWEAFRRAPGIGDNRVILLTTAGAVAHVAFAFRPNDVLLLGRESTGVPPTVHESVAGRVVVPMAQGTRSLNVVVAAAMVAGEALRQTGGFPGCVPGYASSAM